jgi:hypothetical protein
MIFIDSYDVFCFTGLTVWRLLEIPGKSSPGYLPLVLWARRLLAAGRGWGRVDVHGARDHCCCRTVAAS